MLSAVDKYDTTKLAYFLRRYFHLLNAKTDWYPAIPQLCGVIEDAIAFNEAITPIYWEKMHELDKLVRDYEVLWEAHFRFTNKTPPTYDELMETIRDKEPPQLTPDEEAKSFMQYRYRNNVELMQMHAQVISGRLIQVRIAFSAAASARITKELMSLTGTDNTLADSTIADLKSQIESLRGEIESLKRTELKKAAEGLESMKRVDVLWTVPAPRKRPTKKIKTLEKVTSAENGL